MARAKRANKDVERNRELLLHLLEAALCQKADDKHREADRTRRSQWAALFAALASEPRLRIVEILARGTVPCQEILERLDLSQPAVSYHLGKLERAGLLEKQRHGTRNCYRLREPLREIMRWIEKEDASWNTL